MPVTFAVFRVVLWVLWLSILTCYRGLYLFTGHALLACVVPYWQVLDQLKTVPLIPDAAGLLPNRRFTGFHTA